MLGEPRELQMLLLVPAVAAAAPLEPCGAGAVSGGCLDPLGLPHCGAYRETP